MIQGARSIPLVLVFAAAFVGGCVHDETASQQQAIAGGSEVSTCGFPSVVYLSGPRTYCTGTLIHPELVVSAAHCARNFTEVVFDENRRGARRVPITECVAHENYEGDPDWDIQVCRLSTPQTDIPLVPILFGCETSVLEEHGRPVVAVGFGPTDSGGAGIKRQVDLTVDTRFHYRGPIIALDGETGRGGCPGDSGGPSFVQLDDGTHRQFGVHDSASCGVSGITETLLAPSVKWIERHFGVDLTPCYERDGTAIPGASCDAPTDLATGVGTWPSCGSGPVRASSLCESEMDAGLDGGSDAGPDGAGPNAGVPDTGASDAGVSDSGTDIGSPDGGPADSGAGAHSSVSDGSRADALGGDAEEGGCATTASPSWSGCWLAVLLFVAFHRRYAF